MADYAVRAVLTFPTTLTGTFTTPDGVALAVGDRVLAVNQADPVTNGIYYVQTGIWTRDEDVHYYAGLDIRILQGTTYAMSTWALVMTTLVDPVLDTDALVFRQIGWGHVDSAGAGLQRSDLGEYSISPISEVAGAWQSPFLDVNNRGQIVGIASGTILNDLITGLNVDYIASNGSIVVHEGAAWVPGLNKVVTIDADRTLFPTGSSTTLYHVYLTEQNDVGTVLVDSTAPAAPYFGSARVHPTFAEYRYIGTFLQKNGGTGPRPFKYDHMSGLYAYLENTEANPYLVVNAGTATTAQTLSLSSLVPVSADFAWLLVSTNTTSGTSFGTPEDNVTLSATASVRHVRVSAVADFLMPINKDQVIKWLNRAAGGSTDIFVLGYVMKR